MVPVILKGEEAMRKTGIYVEFLGKGRNALMRQNEKVVGALRLPEVLSMSEEHIGCLPSLVVKGV
eukprot:6417870-Amphidinium_carterae.1